MSSGEYMPTVSEEKLANWLRRRKVATLKSMEAQFQVSRITVLRRLNAAGYRTSYNHNGSYYTLAETPEFDESGLWSYRDIHFSVHGTLTETLVATVDSCDMGMTVAELEDLLEAKLGNLLSRLVKDGRLTCVIWKGRKGLYLSADTKIGQRQFDRRQRHKVPVASDSFPENCSITEVVEVLRQIILSPNGDAKRWSRQLIDKGVHVTTGQVQSVIEHFGLKKKRRN